MSKKIIVEQYGLIHFHAYCQEPGCDFNVAIRTEETPSHQDVRNAVRKHVRKTGHRVSIEGGTVTDYSLY